MFHLLHVSLSIGAQSVVSNISYQFDHQKPILKTVSLGIHILVVVALFGCIMVA